MIKRLRKLFGLGGDWRTLSKEERLRAKALMYGCHYCPKPNENGKIEVEIIHASQDEE
ncbi:MAG: hypothetical protein ACI8W8_003175 [Rhodothermales bacterium]|jgi:hypothetical protein